MNKHDWGFTILVVLAGWKAVEIIWWIIKGATHL